jgi:hypothetical protein
MEKLTYKKIADGHYECIHCGVVKEKQNTMHYHMKKHAGTYPHKCAHCDKEFLQKKSLDLHVEAKHPETLKKPALLGCPCCDFESRTKANLYIHFMRIHCKDICTFKKKSVASAISCGHCEQTYTSQTAYYYHAFNCCKPDNKHTHYSEYTELLSI